MKNKSYSIAKTGLFAKVNIIIILTEALDGRPKHVTPAPRPNEFLVN